MTTIAALQATIAEQARLIDDKQQLINELSIDPGFQLPMSAVTYRNIRAMRDNTGYYSLLLGDIKNLKQLNTAFSDQCATDAVFIPALQARAGETLVHGKGDAGDQVLYVIADDSEGTTAQAMAQRINRQLEQADVSADTRKTYAYACFVKYYGGVLAWLFYALYCIGLLRVYDKPSITFVAVRALTADQIEAMIPTANRMLFAAKKTENKYQGGVHI